VTSDNDLLHLELSLFGMLLSKPLHPSTGTLRVAFSPKAIPSLPEVGYADA